MFFTITYSVRISIRPLKYSPNKQTTSGDGSSATTSVARKITFLVAGILGHNSESNHF